jgi:His/Glu/Gln/Arg/opine family amino acid ABC transporter permease subunit
MAPDYLLEQPLARRLLLFLVLFALLFLVDLSGGGFAQAFLPAIGFEAAAAGEPGALFDRILLAAVVAAGLTLNFMLILVLPFIAQIGVVWGELLIAFLAFFYSFDLSFPFIAVRLPILILTGAFTTIYVSLISIAIACVLALIGALARLSKNGPAYGVATFYISFFRGTPLLLQVFIIYLGLPQMGLILDPVPAGIIALSLCPVGSRHGARPAPRADHAQGGPAPGHEADRPAHGQPVHRHAEGLLADLGPGRAGVDVPGAHPGPLGVQALRDADHRGGHLLDHLHRLRTGPGAPRGLLRQGRRALRLLPVPENAK